MYFLTVEKRTPEENPQTLRAQGIIPAVVYGHGIATESIKIPLVVFEKMYKQAGRSSLVSMAVGGCQEPRLVIIQEVQYDPVRGTPIHADFHQIRQDEEMHTEVKLAFRGESLAVKNLGCVLVKQMDELEVSCLPKDLVPEIAVDVSVLANVGDVIRVKDLVLPPGMKIKVDPNAVVAGASEQKEEAEAPQVSEAEAIAAQAQASEKKKEEGEEGEEEKSTEKKPAEKEKDKK